MSIQPQKYYPEKLAPVELDDYLERGWFRMRHYLYTTHFLHQHSRFYNTVWLRLSIADFEPTASQEKLMRRNTRFNVKLTGFEIDSELEELYALYAEAMPFLRADGIESLLGPLSQQVFDTRVIKMYDNGNLIAAGIFDVGKQTAAGIGSVYHPSYARHSLGKSLVMHKLAFCKQNNIQYFYPGYNVLGHPRFRYKLDICPDATEYFDIVAAAWKPYYEFDETICPLERTKQNLEALLLMFKDAGIAAKLRHYPLFDAGLWFHFKEQLMQFPLFLKLDIAGDDVQFYAITHDLVLGNYSLWACVHRYSLEMTEEVAEEDRFDTRLFEASLIIEVQSPVVFLSMLPLLCNTNTNTL